MSQDRKPDSKPGTPPDDQRQDQPLRQIGATQDEAAEETNAEKADKTEGRAPR